MIELGPGADLFRLVGGIFWLLVFGGLLAALLGPKTWIGKTVAVTVVVGLFLAFPGRWAWEQKQAIDAFRARRDKAEAIFKERCKITGEKIYRTVEGVEGFLLVKVRPYQQRQGHDQNAIDPYGANGDNVDGGTAYIATFMVGKDREPTPGDYSFIEAVDPQDGIRYRYTMVFGVPKDGLPAGAMFLDRPYGKPFVPPSDAPPKKYLMRQPASGPMPRYGVDFEDLTTPEERSQWVAGGAVRIVDLQTKEVIAERIGYMMDRGMGVGAGNDWFPWSAAAHRWSCPHAEPTKTFVSKVLKPKEQ